jgi:choice-of-anchor B domain-containing protein
LAWIFQAEVGGFEHVLSVAVDAVSGKVLQSIDLVADTEAHLDEAEHHSHAHDPEKETQNPARSRELKRNDVQTKVRIPAELHCTDECLVGDPNSSMSSVKDIKLAHWASAKLGGRMPHNYPSVVNQPKVSCTNGVVVAGGNTYACDNVDMYSFLSISDLSTGINGNFEYVGDLWGWQHQDGREFTIQCMNNAVVFIDSTDPTSPVHVATMMSVNEASSYWCDVKVHKDTAYVVKDSASQQGIQVFDLNRLVTEGSYSGNPPNLGADFNYNEHGSSHNLAVNTETDYLYSIGTSTCSGGLHMIDISSPLNPAFAGCAGTDGYIHDTQCVTYTGPDTRYTSRELCFGFNEDTLTIYDVTAKNSPAIVFRGGYEGSAYTHQGWLNAEMTSLLLNDELDENYGNTDNSRTRTYVWDITTLDAAFPSGHFDHPEQSIDHNLYMWGPIHKNGWGGSPPMTNPPLDQYSYLSNYCSGLRIVDLSQQENGVLHQAGYFDTDPACDTDEFEGAWSNYMHPSGTIAVANIGSGVFFLDFAYTFTGPPPTAPPTRQPTPEEGDGEGTYRGWGIPNLDPSKGDSELHVNPSQIGGANTLGWHATSLSQEYTDTRGNNVFAQENSANSDDMPPNGYRPTSQSNTELLFDFPMNFDTDPAAGTNLDATVTNLFYMNNIMHDVLYTYGFDEVSGNFQENNLGRGGSGGDAVVANAMDGSGSNNANMYTPSDGSNPRMRMYRWDYVGNIDQPSSLDGMVVAHEYGHGLSNRLTGGPGSSGCLGSTQSGGMGEGWSDYLGVMMAMNSAEDYEGAHGVGGWLVGGIGIREYPYSLDMTTNPMTFADVNAQGGSVHGIGTVWCTILFDMSADLVAAHGYSSNIYQNGNPGGNNIAFANVVDGMKLQPCSPNFIQARDAILLADQANYDGVHQCTMWRSFARRGLGTTASFANTAFESFCIPEECGGEYCVETPSPTMPAYPDQDLGVLTMGSTTSLEGSTASRSDTYGNSAPDVRVAFAVPDSLPVSTTVTISLCSSFSDYDTYLWLLDSNGNAVASNDDSCFLKSRIDYTGQAGNDVTNIIDATFSLLIHALFSLMYFLTFWGVRHVRFLYIITRVVISYMQSRRVAATRLWWMATVLIAGTLA